MEAVEGGRLDAHAGEVFAELAAVVDFMLDEPAEDDLPAKPGARRGDVHGEHQVDLGETSRDFGGRSIGFGKEVGDGRSGADIMASVDARLALEAKQVHAARAGDVPDDLAGGEFAGTWMPADKVVAEAFNRFARPGVDPGDVIGEIGAIHPGSLTRKGAGGSGCVGDEV